MGIEVPIIILLISLPVYFLIREILKKLKLGTEKNRWLITFVITLFVSPIMYVLSIMIWMYSISYYPRQDFDNQQWITEKDERFKMSEDIIESKLLIGKSKVEIVELLGDDFYSYDNNHISYDLGHPPGLVNIDPDVLDIYFENGKVIKVDQHET
ncbi:hypothetical protein BC962_3221 [Gillisia mitskevichiae]|uniref:Uncharacterized protein n=1 Tax=Gillisia mitskevichiae TaxID=270921 RepID=A0A495NVW9_9FLAO|nr:hypothetical protein [Gillisia mitskevichiae]RKS42554.1 hypothetical protein BC962_3221 [Gillisia mitskevichiae]